MSAFVAGTLSNMDETAAIVLGVIGEHLNQHSFDVLKLTQKDEILKILQEPLDASDRTTAAQQEAVSDTVANINKVCALLLMAITFFSSFTCRYVLRLSIVFTGGSGC